MNYDFFSVCACFVSVFYQNLSAREQILMKFAESNQRMYI